MTPSGLLFLAVTLAVGLLAFRTGNNLFYALFSLFLGAAALSRFHPWASTRAIRVAREFPEDLFAGRPAPLRVAASNGSRFWTAWAVTVRDLLDVPAFREDPHPFFPRIPPGGSAQAVHTVRFRRRGRYRATAFEVLSSFPFGFFGRRVRGAAETAFTVFPRPRPVPRSLLPPEADEAAWGPQPSPARGDEDEFKELREYRTGDPPRKIHWKTSARVNALMIREMETARRSRVTVLLDTSSGTGRGRLRRRIGLERGVRVAASLAIDLERRGFTYRFGAFAPDLLLSPFGRGAAHLRGVLGTLSDLGPTPSRGPGELVREAALRCGPGTRFVVLLLGEDRKAEVREAGAGAPGGLQAFDVSRPGLPRVV
jgi:uncharacterized protein (DUF58 family)